MRCAKRLASPSAAILSAKNGSSCRRASGWRSVRKFGIGRVRAVEDRLAPQDELAHATLPRGVEDVASCPPTRARAPTPRACVGEPRKARCSRVSTRSARGSRRLVLRRWAASGRARSRASSLRRCWACSNRWRRSAHAVVFFEQTDEVPAEERSCAGWRPSFSRAPSEPNGTARVLSRPSFWAGSRGLPWSRQVSVGSRRMPV